MVLQVCDDNGACTPAAATVTITNVPPAVTNDRPAQSLRVGQTIAVVTVSATDLTSDLPFSGSSSWTKDGGAAQLGLPPGLTVTPGTCTPSGVKTTCIWTLAGSKVAVGAYVVTVSVSDHDGGKGSTNIAVTVLPARIFLPLIVR